MPPGFLVALFVAALLNVTGAQAAPEGVDAAPAGMERVSVGNADYFVAASGEYIKNLNSGKCMGVAGGDTANGVFSVQWTCHQIPGSDQDMFIWQVDGIWHKISPEHSSSTMVRQLTPDRSASASWVN